MTGTKNWSAGDVLNAADLNSVSDQVVFQFADSAARDAGFGGAGEPTLADGMCCVLLDTNEFQIYDSGWVALLDTDTLSVASGAYSFTGDVGLSDAAELHCGTGDDLKIYATGTHSYIVHNGDGNFYIQTAGTGEDLYIDALDNLYIQTASTTALEISNAQKLMAVPTYNNETGAAANMHIGATGEIYKSTSSLRYKTDVEDMDEAWADKVLELRPVWFRSTCTDDRKDWSHWGLIAEEVALVDPRLVEYGDVYETDEDGALVYDVGSVLGDDGEPTTRKAPRVEAADQPVGVAYDRIVPALLSVIRRLEARVAALEA